MEVYVGKKEIKNYVKYTYELNFMKLNFTWILWKQNAFELVSGGSKSAEGPGNEDTLMTWLSQHAGLKWGSHDWESKVLSTEPWQLLFTSSCICYNFHFINWDFGIPFSSLTNVHIFNAKGDFLNSCNHVQFVSVCAISLMGQWTVKWGLCLFDLNLILIPQVRCHRNILDLFNFQTHIMQTQKLTSILMYTLFTFAFQLRAVWNNKEWVSWKQCEHFRKLSVLLLQVIILLQF